MAGAEGDVRETIRAGFARGGHPGGREDGLRRQAVRRGYQRDGVGLYSATSSQSVQFLAHSGVTRVAQ